MFLKVLGLLLGLRSVYSAEGLNNVLNFLEFIIELTNGKKLTGREEVVSREAPQQGVHLVSGVIAEVAQRNLINRLPNNVLVLLAANAYVGEIYVVNTFLVL